ncbi:hypothetical protein PFICI_08484 [Pestalotiopsis fici W106-1]|uniref:Uncharacterized protein n=1 Tax=Pestalotiopsis fici (strain W106-1 / CGMCC3.15140) TaxID=1229662 RepID=W3X4G4_PESFW|nr:uncharacterized protein PFICI_08484 [Pestalotiopsis fici W106-1]ETS80955.1 hypothetical protein PFICI_08484 [Pestalotiopsis fici W106-1]
MDVPTDSDYSEDDTRVTNHCIDLRNVPALVTWRDSRGDIQSLADLQVGLVYRTDTQKALVKLHTNTKLKKGPAKPTIFLFIDPHKIRSLEYIDGNGAESDEAEKDQGRYARGHLNTSTHGLKFTLRASPTFVVPAEYPFQFFRAGSQNVWRTWRNFARDISQFTVHFPSKTARVTPLSAFCKIASTPDTLLLLEDTIASLYGGKGGKVVNLNADESDGGAGGVGATCDAASSENDAPPAYVEDVAGSSISAVAPPLCLSPGPGQRKRRRMSNGCGLDEKSTARDETCSTATVLQMILKLQKTVDEGRAAQDAALTKILAKVDTIESRLDRLEAQQRNLLEEVETQVEAQVDPLWDELSARLQSQEDREHDYIRDMIEESFDEKIDEKIPDAVNQYFSTEDDAEILAGGVIGEKIREETRAYLRSQQFTGHFTIVHNE